MQCIGDDENCIKLMGVVEELKLSPSNWIQ